MKKRKNDPKYMRRYRRQSAMKQYWSKCSKCGREGSLYILTVKKISELSPKEIKEIEVACPACLLSNQPLASEASLEARIDLATQ